MADNITLNSGTGGQVVRTQDVTSVHYPVGLVAWGPDGGPYTEVSSASAGGLPVQPDAGAVFKVSDNSGSLTVDAPVGTPVFVRLSDGSAAITTLPVSAASLPLPSGASTSAKQPAIGTAGTASSDVITVQGIASMTALKVDGSAVTQPVSGTITANQGGTWNVGTVTTITTVSTVTAITNAVTVTNAGTFAVQDSQVLTDNAAFTDGTSKVFVSGFIYDEIAGTALTENDAAAARINVNRAQVQAIEDGATRGRYATVSASNALKVDGSAVTQPISAASLPLPSGAATAAKQPALGTAGAASADVITIQGIASMTAVKVDGSAVTQPVSGTVTANQGGTWTVQPGNTANTTAWLVSNQPVTSGGLTPTKVISAASTNATSVKGSAGQVYAIMATNTNAAIRWLKLYNKATAPTVGTDTPVLTFGIPGNTAGAGFTLNIDKGIAFATGIGLALTTGSADADTGAVAAGEIVVNLMYK